MYRYARRLLAVILTVATLLTATSVAAAGPSPQAGDPGGGGSSTTQLSGYGMVAWHGSGYRYHIPVCLDPSFWNASSGWNLSLASHAAANRALHNWDDIGGELYFYRTDTACSTLYNLGTPYVSFGRQSLSGDAGQTNLGAGNRTTCQEPWGIICYKRAYVSLNSNYTWYFNADQNPPGTKHDAEYVLTHELGHALGLDSGTGTSIMVESYGTPRDPSGSDIAAYIILYGDEHCDEQVTQHPC